MKGNFFKKIVFSFIFICIGNIFFMPSSVAQTNISWADSVLKTLTLDEKIAQLMMIRAHSNKDEAYNQQLVKYVEKHKIGGLCFFQGGPYRQAALTNRLQAVSEIPLMVSIDGEWGLGMRLDSVTLYPRQMALGATNDTSAIYKMGASMAQQCRRLGIHVNFAPCVDVNNNAMNPVINSRSFGSDPQRVANCATAYAKGMQDNGLMACVKHFPGHGDTKVDSHKDAPIINHSLQRLDSIELYPFNELFQQGVDAVMVGHLLIPALDSVQNAIATCSKKISTDLLQKQMNFKGLIFTDALEMGGIVKLFPQGELEVRCLIAGCDVLLIPGEFSVVAMAIKQALLDGRLTIEDIDNKCLKILKMKEKYVLNNSKSIDLENIKQDLNLSYVDALNAQLMQKAVTLLSNKNNILPLEKTKKGLYLRESRSNDFTLKTTLERYLDITTITEKESLANATKKINDAKQNVDYIIVSLSNLHQYPSKQYGLNEKSIQFLKNLTNENIPVILLLSGNPYALNEFPFADKFAAIVVGYHPLPMADLAIGEAICGKNAISGQLPIELNQFPLHTGIFLSENKVDEKKIKIIENEIDTIVENAIQKKAFPGCQILIAQKNNILFKKNYGSYTYDDKRLINDNTIYDLASLTKVMATTLAIMKLYEDGKIDLNAKLSKYLPETKNSNKSNIPIYRLLTHTAGLQAWIAFYKATLNNDNSFREELWKEEYSPDYALNVAKNEYLRTDYADTILTQIINSPLRKDTSYLYSDMGFYLLAEIIHRISGKTLDIYLYENFYKPMQLKNTCFNPLEKINKERIAPTENDTLFRRQLLCGYVHDQGAALLGGISGHAGLFSNIDDLYAIAFMLVNNGFYKNYRYLQKSTIDYFTSYYFPKGHSCRRALGFDKPSRGNAPSPCCKAVSSQSFGHSGFTGTFIWIDPHYDLIYIFLSNRVHPSAENNKLNSLNVRSNIHSIAYKFFD